MRRRQVLVSGGALGLGGCFDLLGSDTVDPLEDRASAPYESVPDTDTILQRHETVLAGEETAVRTTELEHVVEVGGESETIDETTTTTFDFSVEPPRLHVIQGDGREVWHGPDRTLVRTRYGQFHRQPAPDPKPFSEERELLGPLSFEGPEPIDGTSTSFRYRGTGADVVAAALVEDDVTVHHHEATLDLRGDGLIQRISLEYSMEAEGQTMTHDETLRYDDLGVPVEPPDWVETAREVVPPGPDETVTVTRSVGDAELRVTGAARDVAREYTRGPALSRGDSFSAASLSAAQVSCTVQVRLPERYHEAEITIPYEDEHVPNGDEAGLTLTRYVTSGTFTPLGGVDMTSNTATASVPGDGYYFVMHEPTYESAFRRGEELEDPPPPPECGQ